MRMKLLRVIGVTSIFATLLLAADNPFIGTWKINPG
jgi:hypothetical protein